MRLLAGSLLAASLLAVAGRASATVVTPDDLYRVVSVGEPAFSPDGTRLATVERRADRANDKRTSDLILTDIASKTTRALTFHRTGVAAPAWSPAGDAIAFIANDADRHGQVFVMPLDGGDARQVTKAADGVQQFAWRPDGDSIAYVTSDPDPHKADVDKHHDLFDLADDDYMERSYSPPSHLWLVSRMGEHAHRLTSGSWSVATAYPPSPPASPLSWSPDGKSLLFSRVPDTRDGDAYRSQIEKLDLASGKLTPLTSRTKLEGFATYSPDGEHVAYLYSRDGDPNNENDVFVTSATGGPGIDVSRTLDRAIFRAQWFPDGKSLLVGAHDGTRTLLWRLRLDGTFERIDTASLDPTWSFWLDTAIARDGAIAFPASTPARPTELYVLSAAGGEPQRLSDLNGVFAARTLGVAKEIAWENDGFHETGVLLYPPNYAEGKRYPLVLNVHGGPQAASDLSFDIWGQTLAAHGWLVFEPNYRGSDDAGNAYERAIYMDAGAGPGRDVMAGVAAVEKLGIVDTSRIAVGGWSYGGYMTSWLMSHYHIWRTAISGAAVNNWLDMYDLGDANVQIAFGFRGSPWTGNNARDYAAQSPITYAAQTRCPVLVISDIGDVRVPVTQSFEMYHALADNHIPVRFVGVPVDGHFPGDPVRRHDVIALWNTWLADHLK
jgi:dipeptidyl aminopeptidase/acylaminoacyl peptidase